MCLYIRISLNACFCFFVMEYLDTKSNIWKTAKEKNVFIAWKNVNKHSINKIQILSITIRVGSLKKLYQVMKKIDHEHLLEDLILAHDLTAVQSFPLGESGELLIEKNDAVARCQDLQVHDVHEKHLFQKIICVVTNRTSFLINHYYQILKNLLIKFKTASSPSKKESKNVGIAILLNDFCVVGEKPYSINPGWLHEQVLPRALLRAVRYKEEDREEMLKREKAAARNEQREIHKTLKENREGFERTYHHSHPDCLFRRMTIRTVDHISLDTFAIVSRQQALLPAHQQRWILFLNPGDEAYENQIQFLSQILDDTGANIYTGNYRGVGASCGRPTCSHNLVLDGEAMVQHLLQSGVLPHHILVHGASLGGGVATEVVAMHSGMHLCNDRSFTRFTDAAHELAPLGFKEFTVKRVASMRWELDTVNHLENITGHIMVISSDLDGKIRGKAILARWVSMCTGFLERNVIWLTEKYLDAPDEITRSIRAHCDPITTTSKYEGYLAFVKKALALEIP